MQAPRIFDDVHYPWPISLDTDPLQCYPYGRGPLKNRCSEESNCGAQPCAMSERVIRLPLDGLGS